MLKGIFFNDLFQLIPLLKRNEKSAAALMAELRKEAEELRKEKKRNTISGIHKYVKCRFGCLFYSLFILPVYADFIFITAKHFVH